MDQERRDFVKGAGVAVVAAMAAGAGPAAAQPKPVYEIYAAKYAGPFTSKLAFLLFNQGWDQDIDRYYYIWVVKGPTETILVDTGVGLTVAADRKLKGYVNPIDVAARIGVKPDDVTKVVITHMHWDHVGGMEMMPKAYPKATFYVQKREYDFWTKHPVAKRKIFAGTADPLAYKVMQDMEGTPRLQLVNGDMNIGPGLDIMLGPGHTIGTQSLAVPTAKGTAVVASDCGHLARNFKEDTPSILITDLIGWMETYDKVRAKASSVDLCFPGHDAAMLLNYPKVAEDVTRLA
ncbi:MAG TPA: N-acyl homoserine lactonase family protein [Candidatus Acidoferrales bacterium]|nr:N-acyl homoserine lactonase family protein [Candidatus Acidoferrales bacterium]